MLNVWVLTILLVAYAEGAAVQALSEPNTKIVGGKDAPDGAFPYQVSLRRTAGSEFHFCGGSIIEKSWVLTAAHCTIDLEAREITVVAGTNSLSSGGTRHSVEQIINHERYNRSSFANDIAVLKMKIEFEYSDRIASIALPEQDIGGGVTCIATGWGYTNNYRRVPDKLQMLEMDTVSLQDCQNIYRRFQRDYPLTEKQVCALRGRYMATCNGDSGGPLAHDNKVIGIVSYGEKPCGQGRPEVFANVYGYLDWIASNTK